MLASLLLLGWAALLPAGKAPQWWHYAAAAVLILAFVGSWHGQLVSTVVARWTPMALHNRRERSRHTSGQGTRRRDNGAREPQRPTAPRTAALEADIVIHLRPHPHALTTRGDRNDQLPWEFITAWLNRSWRARGTH